MNYLTNLNIFRWKKNHYSEFYISTLISFFVFSLGRNFVISLALWGLSGVQALFQYTPAVGEQWYMLVLVCFLITSAIQTFLIHPLQFGMTMEARDAWENFFTGIIVFGFFLFLTCFVFNEVALPDFPILIKRLLKPTDIEIIGTAEKNFWSIVPWIWLISPIFIFYYSLLNNKAGGSE